MKKRNIAIVVFSLALIGILAFGTSSVSAHWFGFGNSNLVSDLAKKLGVGEDKVKQAFDTIQSERQKQMRTLFEERLTQMVKDGKITESQKQAILKKHDELQSKRTSERQEMENWAKQNGLENIMPFSSFGRGMHGGWMMR
ncbi:hypothetical protein HY612_05065 [Candidatus Roizmanbacteria bacterium]|nr:hypothetical protein [Candidatus Roizmanbacteria bacterium]